MQKNDELVDLLRDQTRQMREQQQQMNELVPMIGNTTNNQFNLNIFLNEKCKNALNLTDFVESLQLKLEDLEKTNKLGIAEGASGNALLTLHQKEIAIQAEIEKQSAARAYWIQKLQYEEQNAYVTIKKINEARERIETRNNLRLKNAKNKK